MPGYDQEIKVNSKFLRIKADKDHDVRLLNQEPSEIFKHQLPPPANPALCVGEETCPYCQKGDDPTQKFVTNVYDHTDGKVLIWEYGSTVARQLQAIYRMLQEENRQINDIDLKVSVTGSGLTTKYQVTPRMNAKPLPKDLKIHKLEGDVPF